MGPDHPHCQQQTEPSDGGQVPLAALTEMSPQWHKELLGKYWSNLTCLSRRRLCDLLVFLRKTETRGLGLRGALPRSLCHLGVSSGLPSASYVPDFPKAGQELRWGSRPGEEQASSVLALPSSFAPDSQFWLGTGCRRQGCSAGVGGGAGVAMGPSSGTRRGWGFVQHNWVTLVSAHRPPRSFHAAARVRASVS